MEAALRQIALSSAFKFTDWVLAREKMDLLTLRKGYAGGLKYFLEEAHRQDVLRYASRIDYDDAVRDATRRAHISEDRHWAQLECIFSIITRADDCTLNGAIWRRLIHELDIRVTQGPAGAQVPSLPLGDNSPPLLDMSATYDENRDHYAYTYQQAKEKASTRPYRPETLAKIKATLRKEYKDMTLLIAARDEDEETLMLLRQHAHVEFHSEDETSNAGTEDTGASVADGSDEEMTDAGDSPTATSDDEMTDTVEEDSSDDSSSTVVGQNQPAPAPQQPAPAPAPAPVVAPAPAAPVFPPPVPGRNIGAIALTLGRIDGVNLWACDLCTQGGIILSRRNMLTRHFRQTHGMTAAAANARLNALYP